MQPSSAGPPPPMAPSQQYQQYHQPQQQWMGQPPPHQPQPHYQAQPPQPHYQAQPPQPQQQSPYYYQHAQTQGAGPPPSQQNQQPPPYNSAAAAQPPSADEIRSIWIGDLQPWMDEDYLTRCFYGTGEVVSVKVIRNKQTSQSEGYGFIEFNSQAAAEKNLQAYHGTPMPNAQQNFRLNWASLGSGEKRSDSSPEHTIFVGDLAADVTDYILQETFRVNYPSVKGAKVVTDRATGRTKGYGFVKFGDPSEQQRAMTEMNGMYCSSRPMRIGVAANKKNLSTLPQGSTQPQDTYQNSQGTQSDDDPTNTTIFVGNLDTNVSEDALRQFFSNYGQLLHVKIPVGKRCGFVQFADRNVAEEALLNLNGSQLGGQSIRLSWGRSPSNRQPEQNQWNNNSGHYGYTPGYESYGYPPATAAAQDPNMYYGGGYGNYPPPQQQHQQQHQGYTG
ncbi:unnamed protein product [Cuscuta europaea]|uniref:RRM domain-containing protein n=1 Tax=Cuscuta europaea TaxID=41803 RepID=A0A9P0Z1C7_CUSEU|nr:unnamed protein product [Cuscuta europaea]